jgi:secreted trypsin-like serine protease
MLVAGFAVSSVASEARAIIVRGDVPQEAVLCKHNDYPEVVGLLEARAVGTLIHPQWILTAAHVAENLDEAPNGRDADIAGGANRIAEIVVHPGWDSEALGDPEVFDLALLRLERPVSPDVTVQMYTGGRESDSIVQLCGWGRTGDGLDPDLIMDGRFRCGENRVDGVEPRLRFRFDEPASARPVPLEAVSGPGDSGGPAFIIEDGVRYLSGVSSFQQDEVEPGIFGVTENYERIADHVDWILAVIGD